MPTKFDIVLLEKPEGEALTRTNCMDLFDMLNDTQGVPIGIDNPVGNSSAIGFISLELLESNDYRESTHNNIIDFIKYIMSDTAHESESGTYVYRDLYNIYLSK